MSGRAPTRRYEDPLDAVWLATARAMGLSVRRSAEAYASTDGSGTLVLGEPSTLDADDGLAQMIFHELCHALVQGDASFAQRDWGLDNTSDRDRVREHATLRVQAFLASRHGLRGVLAPTTDFREFWDALDEDPLLPRHDPSVNLAILGLRRAALPPWSPFLDDALAATARIAGEAARFERIGREGGGEASREPGELPSLWRDAGEPLPPHPTGLPLDPVGTRSCGTCGWRIEGTGARRVSRCRQADDARVEPGWAACERWEPALDCLHCGACCRSAYDLVLTSRCDPFVKRHPELAVIREDHVEVLRAGDRCAALGGGPACDTTEGFELYACVIYSERPKPCREFAVQGLHCLGARRRLGLSL
jgi:hypothetical protein